LAFVYLSSFTVEGHNEPDEKENGGGQCRLLQLVLKKLREATLVSQSMVTCLNQKYVAALPGRTGVTSVVKQMGGK